MPPIDERGLRLSAVELWPSGVRVPERLARLLGRGTAELGLMEVRLDTLARLLGRLPPLSACLLAAGAQNDSRLAGCPDEGVLVSPSRNDAAALTLLPPVRFFGLRTVTDAGMAWCPMADALRGDARGGVCTGAGSFDRADCTRCSSFCICPMRPRICRSEPDDGNAPGRAAWAA